MNMKKRAEQMDNFRDNPDVPIFLLNKQCGSVGINLTVASHIMILETSWNPVWEDQAISRAHRLGQRGLITVLRYICQGAAPTCTFVWACPVKECPFGAYFQMHGLQVVA